MLTCRKFHMSRAFLCSIDTLHALQQTAINRLPMRPNQQNPVIAAHIQQAVALHQQGEYDQAEALYRKVLAKVPRHFQALYLMGMLELHKKNHSAAIAWMDRALQINPGHVDTQFDRATALEDLQRYDEALRAYELVLVLQSDFTEAQFRRANMLRQLDRRQEALNCYQLLLLGQPEHAGACFMQANTLADLGRLEEALDCYQRAVALNTDHPEAWFNLGNTLLELARFDEARRAYDNAVQLAPDFVEAIVNRGYVQAIENQPQAALLDYNLALQLRPGYAGALFNRAAALAELQQYDAALRDYAAIAPDDPHFTSAQWNAGLCQLKLGNVAEGWRQYERRWDGEQMRDSQQLFGQPLWLGDRPVQGKTILLHAEQGFGDTLQFARYAPLLAQRGAHVILQVQPALKTLMQQLSTRSEGAIRVLDSDDALPPFDLHCPLLSLPLAFSTSSIDAIPHEQYLWADPLKSAQWQQRLGAREPSQPTLRVGLVWAGSNPREDSLASQRLDAERSLPFAALTPLLAVPHVTFHAVQLGAAALEQRHAHPLGTQVHDYSDALTDFSATAALIDNLDLVISVDTAVAHLAASLNQPVWLLNRYNTCWRWLLERSDSPWYPSMRIFRQPQAGDWSAVIDAAVDALRQHAAH
jgi:tetratricopeptide (TPR) repeat protein